MCAVADVMTQEYGYRGRTSSQADGKVPFPISLEDLDEPRGIHLLELYKELLPSVIGAKVWRMNTSGGATKSFRQVINVFDEAFLVLVLMNTSEFWI